MIVASIATNEEKQRARDLLPVVARLQCPILVHIEGSPVFAVHGEWQRQVILDDAHCRAAATPTEFEDAVQSPDVDAIFVPAYMLTWEILQRILTRNPVTKTVFWEM